MPSRDDWNPITLKPYSKQYWEARKIFSNLPAAKPEAKKKVWEALDKNDVILLTADTGAGKTTMVPRHVWEYFDWNGMVVCTQPTKTNVETNSKTVSQWLDVELGNHVWSVYQGSDKREVIGEYADFSVIRQLQAKRHELDNGTRKKLAEIEEAMDNPNPDSKWVVGVDGTRMISKATGGSLIGGLDKLMFITDGSFVEHLMKDPNLLVSYRAVIIDEAHMRNVNMDIVMWFIKEALKNPFVKTKFIIMSATVEKEGFLKYFGEKAQIEHIHLTGRPYSVDIKWAPKPVYQEGKNPDKSMSWAIKMLIKRIFDAAKGDGLKVEGDILVFLPKIAPIVKLRNELEVELGTGQGGAGYRNFRVEGLWAEVSGGFETSPVAGVRRIILSTDVAETGLTINGLHYVIDSGLAQNAYFDSKQRMGHLDTNFISRSAADQRKGRAGRTAKGVCYRLYTEEQYKGFKTSRAVAMEVDNLDPVMLKLLMFSQYRKGGAVKEVKRMLSGMMTPPSKEVVGNYLSFLRKEQILEKLGRRGREEFVAKEGSGEEVLSDWGECIASLETSIEMGKWFLTGLRYHIEPMIMCDLVTMLSVSNEFGKWFKVKVLPDEFRRHYINPFGDLMGLYHIYLDWVERKLPLEYVKLLNLRAFKKLASVSEKLCQNGVVTKTAICQEIAPRKFKESSDMFVNIQNSLIQTLGESNGISWKNLGATREKFEESLGRSVHFYDFKQKNKMISLSRIVTTTFGKNRNEIHSWIMNGEKVGGGGRGKKK